MWQMRLKIEPFNRPVQSISPAYFTLTCQNLFAISVKKTKLEPIREKTSLALTGSRQERNEILKNTPERKTNSVLIIVMPIKIEWRVRFTFISEAIKFALKPNHFTHLNGNNRSIS